MKVDMREMIMAAAKATVQARGYNALSFREIAKEVGIKSASVHHHFATKGDLGSALARRYNEEGEIYLKGLLDTNADATQLMNAYTKVFRSALINDNRMCLCGVMIAEFDNLPLYIRGEVNRFTEINVAWIEEVLKRDKPAANKSMLGEQAMAIFAAVEGAQLIARGCHDISVYDRSINAYRVAGLLP